MNPDNYQPSEPTTPPPAGDTPLGDTPAGAPLADTPAPEAPAPFETPTEASTLEAPSPEAPSLETPTPEAPAPANPETPAFGAVAMSDISETSADPAAPATPETPSLEAPTPDSIDSTESTETPMSSESDSSSISASANFVGEAPVPKAEPKPEDEEEELTPANPVPGSIGSALIYSETAPNNAIPVNEFKKKHKKFSLGDKAGGGMSKSNIRTILVIVAAVALVAALVVVLIFIFGGTGGSKKNSSSNSSNANTQPTPSTPVISSLTCTKEGGSEVFTNYGAVDSGEENIIVMYTDDELTSIGSTMTLDYGNTEAAEASLKTMRDAYTAKVENLGLTSDPFTSSYDSNGAIITVTHQAEYEDLDSKSAKLFDIVTLRGELVTDIETLDDTYTEAGYNCIAK